MHGNRMTRFIATVYEAFGVLKRLYTLLYNAARR